MLHHGVNNVGDLPARTPTIDAIYRQYEIREEGEKQRDYLGGSQIGTECRRALWLSFRHAARPNFPGRILRLFSTGDLEEERLIADLVAAGYRVEGRQHEEVCCGGHVKMHFDGVVLGLLEAPKTWHLLEVKSMNKSNFAKLLRDGVEISHLKYYAQVQLSMGEGGLKRAALFVWCKDNDQLYLERIKYSKDVYEALLRKADGIIRAESPPDRISNDSAFWKCRFCDMRMICHQQITSDINCRTCVHSEPIDGGQWRCRRELPMVPDCRQHLFIPGLLWWETPINGSPTHVEYKNYNNVAAGHTGGNGKPDQTSWDLQVPF